MHSILKDIRYGVRSLVKRPGFTAIAILTLALGIGASTAIFSVVDGVLLRPLPYPNAQRIFQLREVNAKGGQVAFTEPNFLDLQARSHSFDAMAQYNGQIASITGASEPVRAYATSVSADFFNVLSVNPIMGRPFSPEETRPGGPAVALVSYGFWQKLLGGRSDLTGTTLRMGERSFSVIGVMPEAFAFPMSAEIWMPRALSRSDTSRTAHNWRVIGRTRADVSFEQARSELSAIGKQIKQEHGKDVDAIEFTLVAQQEVMVGNVRSPLMMIFGAVGVLLLVACANVANLLLAQATIRQKDFAVRSALGATRFRLARESVTENILLVLFAGSLGVVLSFWLVKLLLSLNHGNIPRHAEIGVNGRVAVFTLALSLLIGIVLGIVPLLRFSSTDLETTLRESGRGTRGSAGQGLRSLLVVTQMALTLVLLIGAGLLARSFYRLLQIDPGFSTESSVAMEVTLPSQRMDEQRLKQFIDDYTRLSEQGTAPQSIIKPTGEEDRQRLFQTQLLERVGVTPGVIATGIISVLPLTGGGPSGTFFINNNPAKKGYADYRVASGGYFAAMRIPVLRGRVFNDQDQPNAPHAAVISQSLAQKYWPNDEPIGQTIQFGNMDADLRLLHVVGVVADVRDYGVDQATSPTLYANALQRLPSSNYTVVTRGQVDPGSLVPAMRGIVTSLDSQVPLKFQTLDQVFSSSLDQRRFSLVIFLFFGATALLLATMGIYGVTTYYVTQRTQEIGIRIALGAQMKDVLSLVLRKSMLLVVVGAVVGLGGAYAATRVMSSLLFEVSTTDVATFVVIPVVLLLVALVACIVPARRATKVDPLVALRYE